LEILFAYLDPMDILGLKKNIISNSNNNKQKNHFTTTLIPKKNMQDLQILLAYAARAYLKQQL
jgi:hypothetical protein